jgi:hypothetical protein
MNILYYKLPQPCSIYFRTVNNVIVRHTLWGATLGKALRSSESFEHLFGSYANCRTQNNT